MGVQHTFGALSTGGGWCNKPGALQPSYNERIAEPWWSWQQWSPKTIKDPTSFISRWPRGRFGACGAAASTPYIPQGLDYAAMGGYEPFSCDFEGNQKLRFIRGVTQDSGGSPLANAIVQGFQTATDRYMGEVTSANDGTFTLGTETIEGVQHYLVAYKAGGGDVAGTTVNTLTSTNVDGS